MSTGREKRIQQLEEDRHTLINLIRQHVEVTEILHRRIERLELQAALGKNKR